MVKNKPPFYVKSSRVLLIVNLVFWAYIAVYYSFFRFAGNPNYLLLKVLLFIEPLLYAAALHGLNRKNRTIYILTILFAAGNAVLSLTDETGLFDWISLALSLLLLINLMLIGGHYFGMTSRQSRLEGKY